MSTICQPHWNTLRKNIDDRGLGSFVAQSGTGAISMIENQVENHNEGQHGPTLANWDPLMSAYFLILQNATEILGIQVFTDEGCVICLLNTMRTDDGRCTCGLPTCAGREPGSIPDFETWLTEAADGQRTFAVDQGWVK